MISRITAQYDDHQLKKSGGFVSHILFISFIYKLKNWKSASVVNSSKNVLVT